MEEHLDDNDVQQYALDQSALPHSALQHFARCNHCRIRAQQYVQIAHRLKHAPKMTVEIDLVSLVFSAEKKKLSWITVSLAASIFIGLLVIGAGFVLLGWDVRTLVSAGKDRHFYLLPCLAFFLLAAGCTFYYREYKHRLNIINLLN